ncbi:MAG: protease complex subunit PrcB family protein [Candidatus Thorarchaeota archaeon]
MECTRGLFNEHLNESSGWSRNLRYLSYILSSTFHTKSVFSQYFEVPFEVVDPGDGYYYATRDNFTITNKTIWEDLWQFLYSGHSHPPELPIVNFTSEMLIAVFQGERGSGGYLINITRIIVTNTQYIVYIDEPHPGENCVVTAVMTYPYHTVKISDYPLNLPVQYVYNITTYNCE